MVTTDAAEDRSRGRLERLLSEGMRWDAEKLAYVVLIALAALSRLYGLGQRVMSHDETTHVYYSWNLYRGLGFRHDPLMHGPLQFHLWALSYFLFGVNDATARLPDAVMGVLAVGLMWPLRRWLGKAGGLAAAVLMLVSPYMLYYSRYAREDAFAIVAGLLMIWAVLSYIETRQPRWLYLLAASLALHFAIKETAYIYAAELLLFLGGWFVVQVLAARWERRRDQVLFILGVVTAGLGAGAALAFFMRDVVGATLALKEGREFVALPVNSMVSLMGLVLAGLGAVLIVASLISSFGRRLRTDFASLDLLVVSGTLVLTQLAAVFLPAETIASYGQSDNPQLLVSADAVQRLWLALPLLLLIAAGIGLAWDWRRWLTAAGVFAAIYVTFYTTLFTHAMGLATGAIGSLAYWLGQQGVSRGSQPWYYYIFLQIPTYEFLPAVAALIAAGYALAGGRRRLREADSPLGELDTNASARAHRLALGFLAYWTVASLGAFTYAGEKMPWLTVHIALPLILVAGWGIGRLFESVDWRGLWARRGLLVAVLLILLILAVARTLGYLLGPTPPFQGVLLEQLDVTLGFVTSLGAAVAFAIGLRMAAHGWKRREVLRLAGVTFLVILFVLTGRAAFRAAYIDYDNATEFLVYAHAASGPKTILAQIEDLSRRTTDGRTIEVAYDNDVRYPFMWYLRDYRNARDYDVSPGRDLLNYPIVIAGDANWPKVDAILGERYYSFQYIRMWWPTQVYFGLTWERVWNALRDPEWRAAVWDIWLDRDYEAYGRLAGIDFSLEHWQPSTGMKFYIRKDIAALIWDYGALRSGYQVEPYVDPYAAGMIDQAASLVVGAGGVESVTLNRPRSLALAPDGSLYVADTGNHRIVHLARDGTYLGEWGSFSGDSAAAAPAGTFNEPWGVAVAGDGTVWVADTWNHRVQHFSARGEFLGMFGYFGQAESPEPFWGPRAVVVDDRGRLFVADTGNKRIVFFSRSGEPVGSFGGAGSELGQLNEPVGLAVSEDGVVYVADTWNLRIQAFRETVSGRFEAVAEWPIEGWFGQSLDNKPYLAVSRQGPVCASDPEGYRILCFDRDGQFVMGWGSHGAGLGQFGLPVGLAFDDERRLWVVDSGNQRLMRFDVEWPR